MNQRSAAAVPSPILRVWVDYRFVLLFGMLMLFFLVSPLLEFVAPKMGWWLTTIIIRVAFLAVLIAAVLSVSERASRRLVALGIAVPGALLTMLESAFPGHLAGTVDHLRHLMILVFLVYITVAILAHTFQGDHVSVNTISASLCVYLLLGVIWAVMYSWIGHVDPEAFRVPGSDTARTFRLLEREQHLAIYFSLTTLTTLGYGDIVAVKPLARMLSVTEAVVGQVYLTVLVARLVGLHLAKTSADGK